MNRLHRLFRRAEIDRDISDEIREHIAEKVDELVAGGMSLDEARARAHREFGNVTLIEEQARATWRWNLVEDLLLDLRYAFRGIRRNPG
jgi:hypothetical protein